MTTSTSTISFNKQEREWITTFAKLNSLTFSEQVRSWTLERLEDELDAKDLKDALENDKDEPIDWAEAKRVLLQK